MYRLSTFTADITPPIGHPCMGGGIAPVKEIVDPLSAKGFVLWGGCDPLVLAVLDWCEVRNDAYERWRSALAEAAHTVPERVLVACVHQHDAPIADLEAQRILDQRLAAGKICDLEFHERAVERVGRAARRSLETHRPVNHYGVGQAEVKKVASNRRFVSADGKISFGRTSSTRDAQAREAPEGTIDPHLKALSFWEGEKPVLALSCYATHPMSTYGRGGVSSDFPGHARERRQRDDPAVLQIYASGASGNVTAGKYNDGSPENRPVLAGRIHQAMAAAFQATRRFPLEKIGWRAARLRLEPRSTAGFTPADLERRLSSERPFEQCLAAFGLSWRKRIEAGRPIDVPAIDFGAAQLVLLPAESYVEFQLLAQHLRPDSIVLVLGYGECAPGYIPTDKAFEEDDTNLHDWCWVAPGSEKAMAAALEEALKPTLPRGSG